METNCAVTNTCFIHHVHTHQVDILTTNCHILLELESRAVVHDLCHIYYYVTVTHNHITIIYRRDKNEKEDKRNCGKDSNRYNKIGLDDKL